MNRSCRRVDVNQRCKGGAAVLIFQVRGQPVIEGMLYPQFQVDKVQIDLAFVPFCQQPQVR